MAVRLAPDLCTHHDAFPVAWPQEAVAHRADQTQREPLPVSSFTAASPMIPVPPPVWKRKARSSSGEYRKTPKSSYLVRMGEGVIETRSVRTWSPMFLGLLHRLQFSTWGCSPASMFSSAVSNDEVTSKATLGHGRVSQRDCVLPSLLHAPAPSLGPL